MAISERALRQGQPSLAEDNLSEAKPSSEIIIFPNPIPPHRKPRAEYIARPISPLIEPVDPGPEPVYGSVTAKQWELWVAQHETWTEYIKFTKPRAENFAAENDLRGTF